MKSRPWEQRFWEKVNKTDGCWLWIGGFKGRGLNAYPSFNRSVGTRFLWGKLNGPIPAGMFVMHTCDNPSCVRPEHLRLGTPKDNTLDAVSKGRISHGVNHYEATLNPDIVKQIRELYIPYVFSMGDIATKLSVSRWAVYDVLRGRSWRSV